MALSVNSQQGLLVLYDLIKRDPDYWNDQNIVEYMKSIEIRDFPLKYEIRNIQNIRSRYNNRTNREKWRTACKKFRCQIGCNDPNVTLFDFLYPQELLISPVQNESPIQQLQRDTRKKIDTLQKRYRRLNARMEKAEITHKTAISEHKKAQKILSAKTERQDFELKSLRKMLSKTKYNSKGKTNSLVLCKKKTRQLEKALIECVKHVSKKQKTELKKLTDSIGIEFEPDESDDDDDDEEEQLREKLLKAVIVQKQNKISRSAVRQFCKVFEDDDINANRLEMRWKQCKKDVTEKYNLNRVVEKTVVKGIERIFTYIKDMDNYLAQIIDVEGPPSTSFSENPALWIRIGGDGRSIYRHSNNILMILALMDPENPRRSHTDLCVHTLMLIDGGESHELLVQALSVVDSWIDRLSNEGFIWNQKLHKVNFVMSGDMKFIQLVKGLQGATCNFSCPLCLKPKKLQPVKKVRPNGGFRCGCESGNDENDCQHWKGSGQPRSQEHADQLFISGAMDSGDSWQHFGHHKVAPLKSIPWSTVICDTLHSLLRITDVLFQTFLEFCRQTCDPVNQTELVKVCVFDFPVFL